FRIVGRDGDQLPTVRQPLELTDLPAAGGRLAQLLRRDVNRPHAGAPIVLVDDAAVVLVTFTLLQRVGLGLAHQERDARAVGRPAERLDALLAVGELLRLAAAERQQIELRRAVAIRRESDRR